MNYLSLFTGGMGGDLAMVHLLGMRCLGYVEIDNYCQRLIRRRIDDGIMPEAPIFGPIEAFISEGYAASYKGMVDAICGGPPCPAFSIAGKRAADGDARNLFPETITTIRVVRPRIAYLENVPGLLSVQERDNRPYYGRILGDLAESGLDIRWRCLSAAELGAPYKRDRPWIMAHSRCARFSKFKIQKKKHSERNGFSWSYFFPPEWYLNPLKAVVDRKLPRMAHRVDRLKILGNGQVPLVAAVA